MTQAPVQDRVLPKTIEPLLKLFCFCGRPEDSFAAVRDALAYFAKSYDEGRVTWKMTGAEQFLCYALNDCDLIEHGSGIGGAWITAGGKEVLAFLQAEGCDWFDKSFWVDSEGVTWGYPE